MIPESDRKIAIDEVRHIVHMMDVHMGTEDLANTVQHLEPTVFQDRGHDGEWSWFLYDKHGNVCDYRNNACYFIQPTDSRIYPAFIGDMLKCSNNIWMHEEH